MDKGTEDEPAAYDPRNVFLSSGEVMKRYRWGQTRGYQRLKDRNLVPPPVMTHPNLWRLDHLMAWEDKRVNEAQKAAEPPENEVDVAEQSRRLAAALPQPKIRRPRKKRAD